MSGPQNSHICSLSWAIHFHNLISLTKFWLKVMKNVPIIWNILKIHYKYIWLEGAVRDALGRCAIIGAKRGLWEVTGIVFAAVKIQIMSKIFLIFWGQSFYCLSFIESDFISSSFLNVHFASNRMDILDCFVRFWLKISS